MYSVDAVATDAWRVLLRWMVERAGVDVDVIDYPPPRPLPALWDRADLACAFMCGFPLSHRDPAPVVLAAPVPSPAAYGGKPEYWTCVIARGDSGIRSAHDVVGKRMAFTTPDSQSGYQALRALYAPIARQAGAPLFASTVGPLVTPRRVVDAVLAGDADAGPVDGYAWDLMMHHEGARLAPLRVVARTVPTPIPPLVGAPGLDRRVARALTTALLAVEACAELAPVREALLLRGFAPATARTYDVLRDAAEAVSARGYPALS